jgi:hypothetical protein
MLDRPSRLEPWSQIGIRNAWEFAMPHESTEIPSENTRVTVALLIRDQATSLIDCLKSLQLQTIANLDLIIVDQGADTALVKTARLWVDRHRSRFSHAELIGDGGGPDASSFPDLVFARARTEMVMLVDPENRLYPRCIEALLRAVDQSAAGAAYGVGNDPSPPGELLTWRQWNAVEATARSGFFKAMLIRKSELNRTEGGLGRFSTGRQPAAATTAPATPVVLVPEILYERQRTPANRVETSTKADPTAVEPKLTENTCVEQILAPALAAPTTRKAVRDLLFPQNSRRRKWASAGYRAAAILKHEGPSGLLRRARARFQRIQQHRHQPASEPPRPPRLVPAASAGHRMIRNDQPAPISANEPARPLRSPCSIAFPAGTVGRFAVMSSSKGNYFFDEIRDLIAAGLSELGHDVVIGDERDGFHPDIDRHVIVAPHEFFFLGKGEALRQSPWPNGVIVVSTEQPSTPWFALSSECLNRADAVWDISASTAHELKNRGLPSEYLALGYAPSYAAFSEVRPLAVHQGTRFLEPAIRATDRAHGPLDERPIDLLLIGSNTPRRGAFLASAAERLSPFRTYLHLHDPSTPALQAQTMIMDTATAIGLSQRSKVLLNIHQGKDVYFEWHRIVLHGIWQKTLVVSEPCSPAPPFQPGVHYVEASLDDIPDLLHYYLLDPAGQRAAQEIASAGHRLLTQECRLSKLLEDLLVRDSMTARTT